MTKEEREYYYDNFEEIMINKIDNKESLRERELKDLLDYEICRHNNGDGRWTKHVNTIVELCGRTFSLDWEEALTEYQENAFYNQPVEVFKHEYQKTITVTEWLTKEEMKALEDK